MQLQPKRPPGRIDRKAALYALEICQLRSAGYTYEAIREALRDVGIELSTSTLRREVRRLPRLQQARHDAAPYAPPIQARSPAPPPPPDARPTLPPTTRGRDAAEAFFKANPSNPLMRNQEMS
ncbi:hypothetical protein ACG04R_27840 [Roseateles sp. BYS78W]|uniref:Uncharacterized protein n=1 Tax=Pelomonas candidula TaxID=3299025 RepID=A0ABW7HKQ5_9BURK